MHKQKIYSTFTKRCPKCCGRLVSLSVVTSFLSAITDPTKHWPWIVKVKQLGGTGRCAPALGCVTASETDPQPMGMGVIWSLAASHVDFFATFTFWSSRCVQPFFFLFFFQAHAHSSNLFICIIAISVTLKGYSLSIITQQFNLIFV